MVRGPGTAVWAHNAGCSRQMGEVNTKLSAAVKCTSGRIHSRHDPHVKVQAANTKRRFSRHTDLSPQLLFACTGGLCLAWFALVGHKSRGYAARSPPRCRRFVFEREPPAVLHFLVCIHGSM